MNPPRMLEAVNEGDSEKNDGERRDRGVASSVLCEGYDVVAENNIVCKHTFCGQFSELEADGSYQLPDLAHHLEQTSSADE